MSSGMTGITKIRRNILHSLLFFEEKKKILQNHKMDKQIQKSSYVSSNKDIRIMVDVYKSNDK